jgi:hypothetical protein
MKMPDRNREASGMAASQIPGKASAQSSGTAAHTQRLADGSPQVRQQQALQRMADGAVLQLKPFSSAVLNVAGEDHTVRNPRRAREEYVTHWVTNGPYWTEHDFQVTAAGAQVGADPQILLFLRNMHELSNLWRTLVTSTLPASYAPARAQQLWILTSPLINLVANNYASSVGDRYSGGAALTQGQGQTRDSINLVRFNHFQSAAQALQQLHNLHPYQRAQKAVVENWLVQFQTSAVAMVQNLMEKPDLDVLRSKAMHDAAETRSNTVGVWKIGQSHVNDIKRTMPGQPTYNLMTEDEFNDEYHRLDYHEVPD